MGTALFPGSFDPLHLGHLSVIEQLASRCDRVIVAAVGNPTKTGLLPLNQRAELIAAAVAGMDNVEAMAYEGLVVDLARDVEATVIVRGMGKEVDAELTMAAMNKKLTGVETIGLVPAADVAHIASRHIRATVAAGHAAALSNQVPPPVLAALMDLPRRQR